MDKVKIGCPIDYTDNEDIERTGLFLREPEIEELEKRLKEINKITDLKQQCKKQKEVIDRIQKIINTEIKLMGYAVNDSCLMLIQDILNEVTNNE